jgi:hypothetical protein
LRNPQELNFSSAVYAEELPFSCGNGNLAVAVRLMQLQLVQLPVANINPVFYPAGVVPETSPFCLTKVFVFIENGE